MFYSTNKFGVTHIGRGDSTVLALVRRPLTLIVSIIVVMTTMSCNNSLIPSTIEVQPLAPFSVLSVSPADQSIDVARDTNISITFSRHVDPATVNSFTVSVSAAVSGPVGGVFLTGNSSSVNFTPQRPFIQGELVTVTVSTGITDGSGFPLVSPYTSRFVVNNAGRTIRFNGRGQTKLRTGGGFLGERVILEDYDGDGDLDAFLTQEWVFNQGFWNNVRLWINDGSGTFVTDNAEQFEAGYPIAVGRLSPDDLLDFVGPGITENGNYSQQDKKTLEEWISGHGFRSNISVMDIRYGSRRFEEVELGDLDNDGDLDLVAGSIDRPQGSSVIVNQGSLMVFENIPDEYASPSTSPASNELMDILGRYRFVRSFVDESMGGGIFTRDIELSDLDGDGVLDVFVLESNHPVSPTGGQYSVGELPTGWNAMNRFRIHKNESYGTGTLDFDNRSSPAITHSLPDTYDGIPHINYNVVRLGDVDGDGDADAIFGSAGGSMLKLNDGTGSFSGETWIHNYRTHSLELGDLDGDGDLDIFFANGFNHQTRRHPDGYATYHRDPENRIFLNNGLGVFSDSGLDLSQTNSDLNNNSTDVALGDIDGDGDLDAIVTNEEQGSWLGNTRVWFNDTLVIGLHTNIGEQPIGTPFPPQKLPSTEGIDIGKVDPGTGKGHVTPTPTRVTRLQPIATPGSSNNLPPQKIPTIVHRVTPSPTAIPVSNWTVQTIEITGDVGQFTSAEHGISNSGESIIHITYYDATTRDLKYKKYNTSTGAHTLPETPGNFNDFGTYGDLYLTPDGGKHLSYFIRLPGSDLGYAHSQSSVEGWTWWSAESIGNVGRHSSIIVDSNGSPHIAYYDATNNSLKHTWGEWQSSTSVHIWSTETIDNANNVGQYASLAVDPNGNLHVGYYDTNGKLKHAYGIETSSGWLWSVNTAVDPMSGSAGEYSATKVDSSGNPHIVYSTGSGGSIDHAWAAWDQNSSQWVWQHQIVDNNGNVGDYSDLLIGPSGNLHVSYYDENNGSLKYGLGTYDSNSNSWAWSIATVDDPQTGASVGKHSAISVDGSGTVFIVYYDETNGNLKIAYN